MLDCAITLKDKLVEIRRHSHRFLACRTSYAMIVRT